MKSTTNPLLSVIMPVYNVSDTLMSSVQSVLQQQVPLELLLINDGSSDTSGMLCDKLATQYPECIRVFHQSNAGVLAARAIGLKHATGDFIVHCDPDDTVPEGAYLRMLNVMELKEVDWVTAPYRRIHKDSGEILPQDDEAQLYDYRLARMGVEGYITHELYFEELLRGYIHSGLWNKMMRRTLVNESVLQGLCAIGRQDFMEDRYILALILCFNAPRIYMMNDADPVYNYYLNAASITENISFERYIESDKLLHIIEQLVTPHKNREAVSDSTSAKIQQAASTQPPYNNASIRLQQAALAGRIRNFIGGVFSFGGRQIRHDTRFTPINLKAVLRAPLKWTTKTIAVMELLGIPFAQSADRFSKTVLRRKNKKTEKEM